MATLAAGVLDAVGDVAELAAENAVNITATLRNDLEGVTEVLENHLEFPFLAKETHPMHGLQDWSTAVWARQIEKNPELSALLAKVLCDVPDDGSIRIEPIELATQVKAALRQAQPLSKWRTVIAFQNAILNSSHNLDNETEAFYIAPELLSTAVFRRDFPLGVDKRVAQYRWKFAIENSGLAEIRHRESKGVTIGIYLLLVFLIVATIAYLLNYTVGAPEDWTMDSTEQDTSRPSYMADVARRTKNRGAVASILTSFTFGAAVNSSLDKFGKIDPATSTVLVGMTLGGTFGYLLDNMLGTDEGLREYLWRPQDGMRFALGRLASDRFGRYIVTILFDMFFTVILFKHFYSMLVHTAGFSKNGREWVANAIVSAFIGVITFQVYANMTRFSWAYPSGTDVDGSWISGPTMLLAVVVMDMVYLTSETRVRIDEPGINDPPVKLLMTVITFAILWLLQQYDMIEPEETARAQNVTADMLDFNLPLAGVCEAQSNAVAGILIFTGITVLCLGGVIFGTSQQTLSGVLSELAFCRPAAPDAAAPATELSDTAVALSVPASAQPGPPANKFDAAAAQSTSTSGGEGTVLSPPPRKPSKALSSVASCSLMMAPSPMRPSRDVSSEASRQSVSRRSIALKRQSTHASVVVMQTNDQQEHKEDRVDHMRGKVCLFVSYLLIVFLLMLFFGFVPFFSHQGARNTTAVDGLSWHGACRDNDIAVLARYGLS